MGEDELNRTVGRLMGAMEQMNERLGEMNQSLQQMAAAQENFTQENAEQHQKTERELGELSAQTRQLQENVKELKQNVDELKKKSGGGTSIKAVDEFLSFVVKWWKPAVTVILLVGGTIAAYLKG
jgi:predicted RNase H-like nuclease (RuvC/YqgF family)